VLSYPESLGRPRGSVNADDRTAVRGRRTGEPAVWEDGDGHGEAGRKRLDYLDVAIRTVRAWEDFRHLYPDFLERVARDRS